jgi:hypothetical protein
VNPCRLIQQFPNSQTVMMVPEVHKQTKPPAAEPLHALLTQLLHASLRNAFRRVSIDTINRIIAGCALIAMVTPLLLWVSWSKTGFFIIIGTAATCVGIIWVLIWLYPQDPF